jgi:hypothetical protein
MKGCRETLIGDPDCDRHLLRIDRHRAFCQRVFGAYKDSTAQLYTPCYDDAGFICGAKVKRTNECVYYSDFPDFLSAFETEYPKIREVVNV